MNAIDFVIVGQPKSGTTALTTFLAEHPEVCMSIPKEPGYFATDFMEESDAFHGKKNFFKTRTPDEFEELFLHQKEGQIRGTASTCNLYSKISAKRIQALNPKVKIIAMLRNPVDFVYSLHRQYVNETVENIVNFEEALNAEPARKNGEKISSHVRVPSYLFYSERVKYAEQLNRYFEVFGRDNVLVLFQEEFKKDNPSTYKKVLQHIGVSDTKFQPNFAGVHESKAPRFMLINKLAHTPILKNFLYNTLGGQLYTRIHKKVNKILLKRAQRSALSSDLRKTLERKYSDEVRKLSALVDKELDEIWYKTNF